MAEEFRGWLLKNTLLEVAHIFSPNTEEAEAGKSL